MDIKKRNVFEVWRFYTLGREDYLYCMQKSFIANLNNLIQINLILAGLSVLFSIFPVFVEKNAVKAAAYLVSGGTALVLAYIARYFYRRQIMKNDVGRLTYHILAVTLFANIMAFGIYVGVWSNPDMLAVNFMVFLVCAFFLFSNPLVLNLTMQLTAVAVFAVSAVITKDASIWVYDIMNVTVALCVSVIFTWYITKYRLLTVLNESKLEKERNTYYDQSTVDELTKLKNRRDFMLTFQRYLTSNRGTDNFLCLAIIDIDFFKNYNDYYGHPQGDECLKMVSNALAGMRDTASVYAARIGGEEFALLWFAKERSGIDNDILRIMQMIWHLNIPHAKSGVAQRITVSMGVHIVRCGTDGSVQAIYDMADSALYEAKRGGRNNSVVSDESGEKHRLTL
jgi:diguanylate cyclase (GGDEF)-like protein